MRHKLVNLCEESFQIASSHKNFSKWLRMTLLKDAELPKEMYVYECPKCKNIQHRFAEHGKVATSIHNHCCNVRSSFMGMAE